MIIAFFRLYPRYGADIVFFIDLVSYENYASP